MVSLYNWKKRRNDKRTEKYWENLETKQGSLNDWQKYQKRWNFIETDYDTAPYNNGLSIGNPAFAFKTHSTHGVALKSDYKINANESSFVYWNRVIKEIKERF